ncbi:MAG: histidine phosphatase family protein [Acidimicrobiales bacterium]
MPRRLVLVRHGETEWSRARRHTGLTDVALTAEGRREAEELRPALAQEGIAAGDDGLSVLTSPLARARETCALAGLGSGAVIWPELVEWDYGEYEGRRTEEIRMERPGWSLWRDGAPGGETVEEVGARAGAALRRLRGLADTTVIFAHGHLLRILAAHWLGLSAADGRLLLLGPATLSFLGWEREERVIERWNAPRSVGHPGRSPGRATER